MKKNTKHRDLCLIAAKWLRSAKENALPECPYVAVEITTASRETPDVFGWNYWTSVLIEVKVSRSDFLADLKKRFRKIPEGGIGRYRYYCCPKGLIKIEDLPEKWGLLWEENGEIEVVRDAGCQQICNTRAEVTILNSIIRREGIKPQIFDYRKNKNKIL